MSLFRKARTRFAAGAVIMSGSLAPAGVRAVDLPTRVDPPVDNVRLCSAYGTGFFTIPGTDTCLRVGGRVRAEVRYLEPGSRADDATGSRARGRIDVDTRSQTPHGLLRIRIQYELTRNTGNYGSDTVSLEEAYIQFGALTAGRTQSFFDFYVNDYNFADAIVSDIKTQVLAYTAMLGSDLSATLSLEDPTERRQFAAPNGSGFPGQELEPAGTRMPDIVGRLLWEPDWGKAQLSAVLHQLRSINLVPGPAPAPFVDTEYGFAVQAGLQLKLPILADGDQLWFQSAYSEGALSYLGIDNISLKDISLDQTDAYVDTLGKARRSRGWSVMALLVHYWTPRIRQAVFGSSGAIAYPTGSAVTTPAGGLLGFPDTPEWRIGSNLGWLPVNGVYLGIEAVYRRVDPRDQTYEDNDPQTGRLIDAADAIEARLRVQRDF